MPDFSMHRLSFLCFFALVIAVYGAALGLSLRWEELPSPKILAPALTFDLVVLVPLGFYFLVVRPRGLRPITVAPVFVLSILAASRIVPAQHRTLLDLLEQAALVAELAIVIWIATRATRAIRGATWSSEADPLEQLHIAARECIPSGRVAAIFASEIAVFYYALFSWRSKAHVPAGAVAFSYHRRSGQGGIVFAFLFLSVAEGLGVHLLLMRWNEALAWVFTALTLYGMLWLVADYRATVLRPIFVDASSLVVRAGLRATAQVPLDQITGVSPNRPEGSALNLAFMGQPSRWILFDAPIEVRRSFGLSQSVHAMGVIPDSPTELDQILTA